MSLDLKTHFVKYEALVNIVDAVFERVKKELENTVARKEKDIQAHTAKLEDDQTGVAKFQKGIKEMQGRVEELEEELEAERQARAKAERQR